jgi:hypothetical protein
VDQGHQQVDVRGILREWQRELVASLTEGVRQLFDSSTEVLLEFADAAEHERLRTAFYDAQRNLYLQQDSIVQEFERSLRETLQATTTRRDDTAALGAETLSLVEKEEYDCSLALETIAQQAVERNRGELHALSQRLSALPGGRSFSIDEVPGHPSQVVRLFDPASRKLDVDKEVRLVFYTLFDRYVVSRLDELYGDFNRRLIGLGVLPNIKFEYQRFSQGLSRGRNRPRAARPEGQHDTGVPAEIGFEFDRPDAAGSAAPARPATPSSAETLAAISALLAAKRRRQSEKAPPLQTSVPITPGAAADVGAAISDARVLQEAPHPVPIPVGPVKAQVAVDATLLRKVRNALEKQRQIIKRLVGQDQLDATDEDVIDIVGMLFEAMLNEELLPNAVKTLLSHLHTRYLKIAVQDPDFLDNSQHPARQLFENMIDAGIRWVREDNLRAGIYPLMQRIVQQLLRPEPAGDDFCRDAIAEIRAFERKLAQQSSVAEGRTLESERGKARLDEAKAIAQRTIMDLTEGVVMAPAVTAFVATTFADYLTLLLLRGGMDTQAETWNAARSIGRRLVDAAVRAATGEPLATEARDALRGDLQAAVGGLIPHHEQSIQRVIDHLAAPVGDAESQSAPVVHPLGPAASTVDPVSAVPFSDADRARADELLREAGSWYLIQRDGDDGEQRVKLLWVNPHTRNLLFVDQHGARVALLPALIVAQKIGHGEIRPLRTESTSFVARSLRRIRETLEASIGG